MKRKSLGGLHVCSFIKKKLKQRCFFNIMKLLRTPISKKHLLTVASENQRLSGKFREKR